MIIEVCVYLIVFGITACMSFFFQRFYNFAVVRYYYKTQSKLSIIPYCILASLFLFPIIAMFALRYGIGVDYYSYEDIFEVLHKTSLSQYFSLQGDANADIFYVEFGYYLLNVIFPSFRSLLWGIGVGVFALLLLGFKEYSDRISFAFAVFIYLSTQFIYFMNGMRFSIAIVFAFLGYMFLSRNKNGLFFLMIIIAVLFHKSCLICLAMYFLKQIKYKSINNIRNIIFFICILSFPILSKILLRFASSIPFFSRYFSKSVYSFSETINVSWAWLFHIVPVLFPLIFLCRREILDSPETKILFRICLMEIPLRMLGFFNTWYTRLSRISQITYVLFIPLVISKVEDRNKRIILYFYYVLWFVFYFAYYAIVNDQGDSLPYVWIFSR